MLRKFMKLFRSMVLHSESTLAASDFCTPERGRRESVTRTVRLKPARQRLLDRMALVACCSCGDFFSSSLSASLQEKISSSPRLISSKYMCAQ